MGTKSKLDYSSETDRDRPTAWATDDVDGGGYCLVDGSGLTRFFANLL